MQWAGRQRRREARGLGLTDGLGAQQTLPRYAAFFWVDVYLGSYVYIRIRKVTVCDLWKKRKEKKRKRTKGNRERERKVPARFRLWLVRWPDFVM